MTSPDSLPSRDESLTAANESKGEPKTTAAQQQIERLVDLGEKHLTLHVDGYGSPYALVNGSDDRRPLRRAGSLLGRLYRDAEGRLPSPYAIRNAVEMLGETARSNGPGPGDDDRTDEYLEAMAEEQSKPAKSVATQLVAMALDGYELGCTPDGEPYGVPRTGPKIVRQLRGGRQSLRAELAKEFYRDTGTAPSQSALADACTVLEGTAQEVDPVELHLRVARHGGDLILDMGDAAGRAIVINRDEWRIVNEPPVLFRRTALTGALPTPETGCKLDDLWGLLNFTDDHRPLLEAVLIAELFPDIPHPVLVVQGEQGTAKTTMCKMLAALLDPAKPQVRKAPKDDQQWVTAAAGSWVVVLDNLRPGALPDWLQDAICRAVTGDGDVRRRLFSDGDLHVIAFIRCIILNGIDLGTLNDDLADRVVSADLVRIPDDARLKDKQVTAKWSAAHPRILGALLDLAVNVLAALPDVQLPRLPRMADFATVLAAVDKVQDSKGLGTYLDQRAALAASAMNDDLVLAAISRAVTEEFTGTAAELLAKITPDGEKWRAPKGWPDSPRAVTTVLKQRSPSLRRSGWAVESSKDRTGTLQWSLTPPDDTRNAGKNTSNTSKGGVTAGQGTLGLAGVPAGVAGGPAGDTSSPPSTTPAHQHNTSTPTAALTSANGANAGVAGVAGDKSATSLFATPQQASKCSLCRLVMPGPFDRDGRCFNCTPVSLELR